MEDIKNLDFKSIIDMIVDFIMSILKFEFPEIGGFLEKDEETTAPEA